MKFFCLLILASLHLSCFAKDYQKPIEKKTDRVAKPAKNYRNPNDKRNYWIAKIEDYFNKKFDSVESDFVQTDSRGYISTGKIFLKRKKGLMKLYYNDPNPNVAIVRDYKLTHFDRDLKEKTVVSVYSSPLAFFLEEKVNLKQNVKVTALYESTNSVVITLKKREDENEGAIVLVFSKKPFQLKGWIISENNNYGRQTQLALKNIKLDVSFSDKEFDKFSLVGSNKK